MERKIATLFKELCCSECKTDFDEDSIVIMRKENSQDETMVVAKLICQHCGKSFGLAFLGIEDLEFRENIQEDDFALKVQEGAPPISEDDVINAHKFIKNMDNNWSKYLK